MRLADEIRFIGHPIVAQLGGHVTAKFGYFLFHELFLAHGKNYQHDLGRFNGILLHMEVWVYFRKRLAEELKFIWHPIIAQLGGYVTAKSGLKQVYWMVIRLCEVSGSAD